MNKVKKNIWLSNGGEQLLELGTTQIIYYLFRSQLATGEKRYFHALQQGETK